MSKHTLAQKLHRQIKRFRPNIIVTGTSVRTDVEQLAWTAARAAGVPSLALVDGWVKIPDRFLQKKRRSTRPTRYGVVDSGIKRVLVRTCKAAPSDVDIVGHPHLEKISADVGLARLQRKRAASLKVAFFSTPAEDIEADHGIEAIQALLPHLAAHAPLELLIKPHPREALDPWRQWLALFRVQQDGNCINAALVADKPTFDILVTADAVIGLPTSVLVEAAFAGIPVMVVSPEWWPSRNVVIDRYLSERIASNAQSIPLKLSELFKCIRADAPIHRDGSVKNATDRAVKAIQRLSVRHR
ncbi:hypothetical protein LJR230_000168 [Trinickia sp. LjRoot230]|uniref:hypothetical protein n=1 Tax=Trinickia sp. LjRoot230 TaxID=3342288 RepID=UPI003ECE518E